MKRNSLVEALDKTAAMGGKRLRFIGTWYGIDDQFNGAVPVDWLKTETTKDKIGTHSGTHP